jgi:hypothetical protein
MKTKSGSTKAPSSKTSRREIGLLVGLTVLLAVVLAPRVGSGTGVPVELYGRWTTDDARYADRALVITDSTVAFYLGPDPISVHRIRRTHTEPGASGSIRYDVEYETEGESQSLSLVYEPSPAEIIRFKNQFEMEWTKAGPGLD